MFPKTFEIVFLDLTFNLYNLNHSAFNFLSDTSGLIWAVIMPDSAAENIERILCKEFFVANIIASRCIISEVLESCSGQNSFLVVTREGLVFWHTSKQLITVFVPEHMIYVSDIRKIYIPSICGSPFWYSTCFIVNKRLQNPVHFWFYRLLAENPTAGWKCLEARIKLQTKLIKACFTSVLFLFVVTTERNLVHNVPDC